MIIVAGMLFGYYVCEQPPVARFQYRKHVDTVTATFARRGNDYLRYQY